jgi:hypothetical protein
MADRLILTAASAAFGPSLLGLLGSLDLNWPAHPEVLVYDLGLDDATRSALRRHAIPVRRVPAFCDHWRKHFTWKLWCLADAPARDILWIDAGVTVLAPVDEIFAAIDHQGYFVVPNYQLLDWEASLAACEGCGVAPEFRLGKLTLAGGLLGFRKTGAIGTVVETALAVAKVERHIAATTPRHRHEQALISLLLYKQVGAVVAADGVVYLGWVSPEQTPGQKLWVHRRGLDPRDLAHYRDAIGTRGPAYRPPVRRSRTPTLRELPARAWRRARRALDALGRPKIYDGVAD